MEETFPHRDPNRELGWRAVGREPRERRRVDAQFAGAVDPQRVVGTGNHEDYSDARSFQDVLKSEEQLVALAVGDQQSVAVLDHDETRLASFGRDILVAFGIRGSEHDERRTADEVDSHIVQRAQQLARRGRMRMAKKRPQLVYACDAMLGRNAIVGRDVVVAGIFHFDTPCPLAAACRKRRPCPRAPTITL